MNTVSRSRVALLDTSVAERIAAGEVVERPASIVKELVENALDAGAKRIHVEIRAGGQARVQVTDDGCGMGGDEAALALSRFATSKIRAWEDMERLGTLGFRGEALPSILAVSRLELLTRETGAPVGTRVVAEGSAVLRVEEAGCPAGTTITVTDLFYNTPARRKFLKSAASEAARIIDLLGKLTLARTDVHFSLSSRADEKAEAREIFNFPAPYGLAERMRRLWNLPSGTPLAPVEAEGNGMRLAGLVAAPPHFVATRARQVIFVNDRLIGPSSLNHALTQGFAPLVPDRRFPLAVLFLDVDPDRVDVNIHPTKAEVRFLQPGEAFRVVRDGVAQALGRHGARPLDPASAVARFGQADGPKPPWRPAADRPLGPAVTPERVAATLAAMEPPPAAEAPVPAWIEPDLPLPPADPRPPSPPVPVAQSSRPAAAQPWQILAQVDRTFIVCLRGPDLYIVDQHTAHERIHYEALARYSDSGRAASQPLLFPLLLELAPVEAEALVDLLPEFACLGYELEPFGGSTFVARALPAGLDALARADVLRAIVTEMVSEGGTREPARIRERLRATTACRASCMAGDVLTREEMEVLLTRLDATEHAGYCPHGRPVSIRLGPDELARLFQRK